MLWYYIYSVKRIRDGQYETIQGGADQRLMRLVRRQQVDGG